MAAFLRVENFAGELMYGESSASVYLIDADGSDIHGRRSVFAGDGEDPFLENDFFFDSFSGTIASYINTGDEFAELRLYSFVGTSAFVADPNVSPVPEPGGIVLAAIGIAALNIHRRSIRASQDKIIGL